VISVAVAVDERGGEFIFAVSLRFLRYCLSLRRVRQVVVLSSKNSRDAPLLKRAQSSHFIVITVEKQKQRMYTEAERAFWETLHVSSHSAAPGI
jgi:hypothetical protein